MPLLTPGQIVLFDYTTNFGQVVLFQRYQIGRLAASSRLTSGSAGMGGPPDYLATSPDTNAGLQITNPQFEIVTCGVV